MVMVLLIIVLTVYSVCGIGDMLMMVLEMVLFEIGVGYVFVVCFSADSI